MLNLYIVKTTSIDELYNTILPNIKKFFQTNKTTLIEDKTQLAELLTKYTNFSLFSAIAPTSSTSSSSEQQNTQPNSTLSNTPRNTLTNQSHKIILLYNLVLTQQDLQALQNITNDKVLCINCKLPNPLPNFVKTQNITNINKKMTIYDAKKILAKHFSYKELNQIVQSLLLPNSDYYINQQALLLLQKQLELLEHIQDIHQKNQLKKYIIQNTNQYTINEFNVLKYFTQASLPQAIQYFSKFLQTQNLFVLTNLLKSQLKIAYLIHKYSVDQIAKKTRKNKYYLESINKATKALKTQHIVELLFALEKLETDIKTGKFSYPDQTFLLFLIKTNAKIRKTVKKY